MKTLEVSEMETLEGGISCWQLYAIMGVGAITTIASGGAAGPLIAGAVAMFGAGIYATIQGC